MAVVANKLLDETAKQIASSLFKNIDKQKLNPSFLQKFADQLVQRLYTPQSKILLTEVKTTKEFTSLISQIKKTYNSLTKELNLLQKSVKLKDKIPPLTNEIKGTITSSTINESGIDTAEERKEGRPLITKGLDELQSVKVEDFSKTALAKLKDVFTLSFGKDLEKTLSTGLKSSNNGLNQKQGLFDDLISGGLFGAGALAAGGTGAVLFKKIKELFAGKKPPVLPAGKPSPKVTTPSKGAPSLPKGRGTPGLERLGKLAGKFAIFDAIFNVMGSVGELSQEKELGTAQKIGAGATALTGVGPDVLAAFDPTSLVSGIYKVLGKESPVGEGAVNELLNVLGLKEKDKSFGETLRGRSVEMFKEYNKTMVESKKITEENIKERGGWSVESVLNGKEKAIKAGYSLRDIGDKITQEQYALYGVGKIPEEKFKSLTGTTPKISLTPTPTQAPQTEQKASLITPQTEQKAPTQLLQTEQKAPLITSQTEQKAPLLIPFKKESNQQISSILPNNLDYSNPTNVENITQIYLKSLKSDFKNNSEQYKKPENTSIWSEQYPPVDIKPATTTTPTFESLTTPPPPIPKLDTLFQPQQLALSNDSLQQIVSNTEGTKDSIKLLSRALDRLAVVLDKKTNTSGTTVINAGINSGTSSSTPASIVASNNFDSIQQVRRQFALT